MAGFIASLTMIGVVSLPVEVRELGVKMTVLRNGLGFLFAPAIVILIGLFAVFVPKQMVADYLGHASGLKGFLLAALLGSLPTGPLYVAFPLAAAMLKKGARIATIIVFLTAWACIKLPQEMVELQFMGLEFTLARLTLTLVAAVVMGLVTEKIMSSAPEHGRQVG